MKFQVLPWSTERKTSTGKPVVSVLKAGSNRMVPVLVMTIDISPVRTSVDVEHGIGAVSPLEGFTGTPPAW
jgi:hypothetical protein